MLRIDHVILAVGDPDAAARRILDEHGLGSVAGGVHPAWGTRNRIVPLGSDYIELIGIADPETAVETEVGRRVLGLIEQGGGLLGWCVGTDELASVAARLGLDVTEGSRVQPDGGVLRWHSAGLDAMLAESWRPFFISWEVPAGLHPAQAEALHRVRPLAIAWVEVSCDGAKLREWIGGEELPVRVLDGAPGIHSAGIATHEGEVVLL